MLDFDYNGHSLSDFGYVAMFLSEDEISLGISRSPVSTEMNTSKNKIHICGMTYNETLSLTIYIMKDLRLYPQQKDLRFDNDDIRSLLRWLTSPTTSKALTTIDEDILKEYDGVFTDVEPYDYGNLYGVKATFLCNAPYGYEVHQRSVSCTSSTSKNFYLNTDELEDYVYPIITYTPTDGSSGADFSIENESDGETMTFSISQSFETVVIDCDKRIITIDDTLANLSDIGWDINQLIDWNGIGTGIYKFYWLGLINGKNVLNFTGRGKFTLKYKVPVKNGGY